MRILLSCMGCTERREQRSCMGCTSTSKTGARSALSSSEDSETRKRQMSEVLQLTDSSGESKLAGDTRDKVLLRSKQGVLHIQNYIILQHIAAGSSGTVKLGLNIDTGTLEALKVIRKSDFNAFGLTVGEFSKSLQRLKHPNVIRTTNVIEDPKSQFTLTVMEYAEGGYVMPESRYTKKCAPLSLRRAKLYFTQMLLGVQYLHENLLLHGDLTLKNMLLSEGQVKICDMDSACHVNAWQRRRTTAAYCAPEIIGGSKKSVAPYSYKSDVWALGVCLYTMIHGSLPYFGTNKYQVVKELKSGDDLKIRDDIPMDVQDLLRGMLNHDPIRRFGTEDVMKNPWVRDVLLKNALMESFNTDPMKSKTSSKTSKSAFKTYNPGEFLFRKGDLNCEVLFILSGEVQISSFDATLAEKNLPERERLAMMLDVEAPETSIDLDFNEATTSMTERMSKVARDMLQNLPSEGPERNVVEGKGASIGLISALKALETGLPSPRNATAKALTKTKVMQINVRYLSSQTINHLRSVLRQRLERNKLKQTRLDLERIYERAPDRV